MVNWETLKLIPTPESSNEIIICLILINAMMFIMAWLITIFILSIATDEVKEETQSKKHKRLKIYQYTIIFIIMAFVSSGYLKQAKERYYTINVELTTEEVKAQEIYNIKEIEKFSETLIRQKTKNIEKHSLTYTQNINTKQLVIIFQDIQNLRMKMVKYFLQPN